MSSNADRFTSCPQCTKSCEMVLSAPLFGAMNNPDAKKEALKKRSHDHTIREMKREPERYGFKAGDKRSWNLRSKSSS